MKYGEDNKKAFNKRKHIQKFKKQFDMMNEVEKNKKMVKKGYQLDIPNDDDMGNPEHYTDGPRVPAGKYESFVLDKEKQSSLLVREVSEHGKSVLKSYMKLPMDIYFRRVFDVFYNFFDAINALDGSFNFWVYGGAFRKIIERQRLGSDIDMYVSSMEDFEKLENILTIMGFNRETQTESFFSHHYSLFGLTGIHVDIVMPCDILTDGKSLKKLYPSMSVIRTDAASISFNAARLTFMSPLATLYWGDFTNSAMIFDNDYNLYYLDDFFASVETRILDIPTYRDLDLLERLASEDEICINEPRYLEIFKELCGYMHDHRTISNRYYRTRKFLKDQDYILTGDNVDAYFVNSAKDPRYLPEDILSGVNEAEYYGKIEKLWKNIFVENTIMQDEMNKHIKTINLRDLFVPELKLRDENNPTIEDVTREYNWDENQSKVSDVKQEKKK